MERIASFVSNLDAAKDTARDEEGPQGVLTAHKEVGPDADSS
jgi:hypothetical protein